MARARFRDLREALALVATKDRGPDARPCRAVFRRRARGGAEKSRELLREAQRKYKRLLEIGGLRS
eukprot:2388356-Lingulodinium_polyedra.AAC.1